MTDHAVWLNGAILPRSLARLDPLAQGFLTGLGVYDTLLLRRERPVFLERHIRRLATGGARLGLPVPDAETVSNAIAGLATAHGLTEGRVRITLGEGPAESTQPAPKGIITLITLAPLTAEKSTAALTVTPFRRNEHSPLAGIKYTSCAENILARRAAAAAGFDEALFLNTAGDVCEGAFSNIFAVNSGRVFTPPVSSGCLPGVMREVVIELCVAGEIPVEERTFAPGALAECEEVFLTSSIRGIQPVHRLDDRMFAVPGAVTALLIQNLNVEPGIAS